MSGKLPPRKIDRRSRSGFGLGLALELGSGEEGAIFLGGNFPRTVLLLNAVKYTYVKHLIKSYYREKLTLSKFYFQSLKN